MRLYQNEETVGRGRDSAPASLPPNPSSAIYGVEVDSGLRLLTTHGEL